MNAAESLFPSAVDTLARVPGLLGDYEAIMQAGWLAGSPAADDAGHPAGRCTLDMATAAWQSGGDNLLAWHHLRSGPHPTQPHQAHYTLIRATLEGAVTCRSLLDPYITPIKRRLRGAAAQLEDFDERGKFEVSIGAPPATPPAKSAAERTVDFQKLLFDARIVVARTVEDVAIGVMNMTDRCQHYALLSGQDGSWVYRILSAFAHGLQWQVVAAGHIVEQIDAPSGDGYLVKLTAHEDLVDSTTLVAFLALQRALQELAWYMGHGPRPREIKLRKRRQR